MKSKETEKTYGRFICEDCGITVFLNENRSAECFCCGKFYSRKEAAEQIQKDIPPEVVARQRIATRKVKLVSSFLIGTVVLVALFLLLWPNRLTIGAVFGSANAQYELALRFENGDGVKQDMDKAVKWYRKAAGQKNAKAQFKLGEYFFHKGDDYAESVNWYRRAAEQGHPEAEKKLPVAELLMNAQSGDAEAQFNLGECYETGKGLEEDRKEAESWFRKAAGQGHAKAQYRLASSYMPVSGIESRTFLRKAAEQGHVKACFVLGDNYLNGRNGFTKDYAEAANWYRKAAEQGDAEAKKKLPVAELFMNAQNGAPDAQYGLALAYKNGGDEISKDLSEAANWYRKAAEQGHVKAQYELALACENGSGVTKDLSEAVKWYRKAAEQGNAEAAKRLQIAEMMLGAQNGDAEMQNKLALALETGDGIPKDLSEAVKWYRKAAEQGIAESQHKLALAYETGNGLPQNLSESLKWYRKVAEQGYAEAQYKLAVAYETGNGIPEDLSESLKWYRKVAEQGYAAAQYKLALALEAGNGIPQDLSEAVKWYRKVAEQNYFDAPVRLQLAEMMLGAQNGDAAAQYRLAHAYETGNGLPQNLSEAAKWYRKAAEQNYLDASVRLQIAEMMLDAQNGDAEAQYKLAVAYENGNGIPQDLSEAAKWYRMAAERGHAGAKEIIFGRIVLPGGVLLKMVSVEAGSFMMGAVRDGEYNDETPHVATLTKDFYIGQTEVTQTQWKAVMGNNPSYFKGNNLPVECVSWNDAMSFCERLNSMGMVPAGWKFTLPTETQWEYAARGGRKSKGYQYCGSNNLNDVAWFEDNSLNETHQVGQKKANELGLYDMSGNVLEWCLDDWNIYGHQQKAEFERGINNDPSSYKVRVIRGGAYRSIRWKCRPGFRADFIGDTTSVGFRVALVPSITSF